MISILMPARIDTTEKQEWIAEAVQSIQKQTFKDWELIIVDDASPFSINLLQPDDRIKIVRTVNQSGPSLCRNDAAAIAKYDCLLPLDADDKLADDNVLQNLFLVWDQNKDKIIYGDLQQLKEVNGQWVEGNVFDLPEYTFQKALDLGGIMPVTAMHSKDCHLRAGGWKSILTHGLEDVEYWISAGKAGFCGYRVPGIVLQYRKHFDSRSSQLRESKKASAMRTLIRELHKDVYEGRFPMGCCGGGKAYIPPGVEKSNEVAPSTLASVPATQKVWVEYLGEKTGSFGIVGKFTGIPYKIEGKGHKLEVHVNDLAVFQRQRGIGGAPVFNVGIVPPILNIEIKESKYEAPKPELTQVLAL